jgi:hypothetical protein
MSTRYFLWPDNSFPNQILIECRETLRRSGGVVAWQSQAKQVHLRLIGEDLLSTGHAMHIDGDVLSHGQFPF